MIHAVGNNLNLTLDKSQTVKPLWVEQLVGDDADHELDDDKATKGEKRADKVDSDDIDKLKVSDQHNAKHGRDGNDEIGAIQHAAKPPALDKLLVGCLLVFFTNFKINEFYVVLNSGTKITLKTVLECYLKNI